MSNFDKLIERVKGAINRTLNLTPVASKTVVDEEGLYDTFNGNSGGWRDFLDDHIKRDANEKARYADYDLMDKEVPEIAAALDVSADYIIYPDTSNKMNIFKVKPKKSNKDLEEKIELVEQMTKFKDEFWSIIREAMKYGDDAEENLFNSAEEIVGFKNIPIDTFAVNMNNGILNAEEPFMQVDTADSKLHGYKPDECLHFCLKTDRKQYFKYGKGVSRIEKARLIYRQVRLMEEGLMISRLSRSNQNYAMIVDVGDQDGDDAMDYLEKFRKKLARRKYVDPSSGRFNFRWNPFSVIEDILLPTRAGSSSNVIPLNKDVGSRNIDDMNYFQNKMIYATNVPKVLIGKDEDSNAKEVSDIQFIAFLRTIRRIQKVVEPEIIRFYQIALKKLGFKGNLELTIDWPSAGTVDEKRKWEIEQIKVQVAAALSQDMSLVDDEWIYTNIMGMSQQEAAELRSRLDDEEQKALDEVDDMLGDAEDMSDEDTDEFDTGDEEKYQPGAKKPTDKKKTVTTKDKENIMQIMRTKMTDAQFETFEKSIAMMNSDPKLAQHVKNFIRLTEIKYV